MRGENFDIERMRGAVIETPPLARGKRCWHEQVGPPHGNTPACAGKTIRANPTSGSIWKHPRLRGENRTRPWLAGNGGETPPLARGKPPAGRGGAPGIWKHPRLRGENDMDTIRTPEKERNTPACAGKTLVRPRRHWRIWKHPRLRGENAVSGECNGLILETPPLARGKPSPDLLDCSSFGNTPACAGKTRRIPFACPERLETPPLARGKHDRLRRPDR